MVPPALLSERLKMFNGFSLSNTKLRDCHEGPVGDPTYWESLRPQNDFLGWIGVPTGRYCRSTGDDVRLMDFTPLPRGITRIRKTRACQGFAEAPVNKVSAETRRDHITIWRTTADSLRRASEASPPDLKPPTPIVWTEHECWAYPERVEDDQWEEIDDPRHCRDLEPTMIMTRDEGIDDVEAKFGGWLNCTHLGLEPDQDERRDRWMKYAPGPEDAAVSPEESVADQMKVESHLAAQMIRDFRMGKIPKRKVAYVLIEFCCSPDSRLSSEGYAEVDGKVVLRHRITESHDITKAKTVENVLELIEECAGLPIVFWGSQPCTAGSTWQRVNKDKSPNHEERIKYLMNQFHRLHSSFMTLARAVRDTGRGKIVFEWPRFCGLWGERRVKRMVRELELDFANFNGCMLGLCSKQGTLMKKPWSLASDIPKLISNFSAFKCDRSHEHAKIAGGETSRSAFYPDMFTDLAHDSVKASITYSRSDPAWIREDDPEDLAPGPVVAFPVEPTPIPSDSPRFHLQVRNSICKFSAVSPTFVLVNINACNILNVNLHFAPV